jgi:hypothetical protein
LFVTLSPPAAVYTDRQRCSGGFGRLWLNPAGT